MSVILKFLDSRSIARHLNASKIQNAIDVRKNEFFFFFHGCVNCKMDYRMNPPCLLEASPCLLENTKKKKKHTYKF